MSSGILILVFFAILVLMVISISKFKFHPFFAIMGAALLLGIAVGVPFKDLPTVIGEGFSGAFKSIGIVVILGSLIGVILEKSGGALKLADMVVNLVGEKHPEMAMMIIGWIVGIPVFCDSGFVVLDPIRRALRDRTKASSVGMSMALSTGLYASHCFLPPTPGPLAAASNLGLADQLLLIFGIGALVSIPALVASYFYTIYIGKKEKTPEDIEAASEAAKKSYEELTKEFGGLPSGWLSLAPIFVPIILMTASSLTNVLHLPEGLEIAVGFFGSPIIAMAIGTIFGLVLMRASKRGGSFSDVTEASFMISGSLMFMIGADGVLGRMITETGFVQYIQENATSLLSIGIIFPFLISATLKTAQGSSTVALLTTSAILGSYTDPASLLTALGLNTPVGATLAMMAVGAGAMTVSHANDSYFFVVTGLGKMSIKQGYKTQTMATLVEGMAAMVLIVLLSLVLL